MMSLNNSPKPIHVCVLACSFEGSDSALKEYEGDLIQTPQNYFTEADQRDYVFHLELIQKATAYRQIRDLVMSGTHDVFYNQCDGAKDEDRAGIEVVQALEEFKVPFTGSTSLYYEMSKPDMKMVAYFQDITTPRFVVLKPRDDIERECAHLRFPVIIKHISGYSSIGMSKDCKVHLMTALVIQARKFMDVYRFALVEEFITGDEATILVCADASEPDGVRVFHPVQVRFPPEEDFKHFDLKWSSYEDMQWQRVHEDDPALRTMVDVARKSFKCMMGSVGYGRIDVRIDRKNDNCVYFLEINPNCGIMYPYGQEGSADWVLRLSHGFKQREFAQLQIREAIRRWKQSQELFCRKYNFVRGYHLCATRAIAKHTTVLENEFGQVELCTKPFLRETFLKDSVHRRFPHFALPIGSDRHYYALVKADATQWRLMNHSCDPNLGFAPNCSLNMIALCDIAEGEELTVDYRQFMDNVMPSFKCNCGKENCAGFIVLDDSHMKTPAETTAC